MSEGRKGPLFPKTASGHESSMPEARKQWVMTRGLGWTFGEKSPALNTTAGEESGLGPITLLSMGFTSRAWGYSFLSDEVTRYVLFPQVEEHPLKLKRGRRQGRGTALLFQSLCFRSSESTFRVPFLSPKPPGRPHSFMLSALRESCTPSPRTVAWATLKAVAVMSQKMEKQVCWAL